MIYSFNLLIKNNLSHCEFEGSSKTQDPFDTVYVTYWLFETLLK